jgi:hypothetical protein
VTQHQNETAASTAADGGGDVVVEVVAAVFEQGVLLEVVQGLLG